MININELWETFTLLYCKIHQSIKKYCSLRFRISCEEILIWSKADSLSFGPSGTSFNKLSIKIQESSFRKTQLKMSSSRQLFCSGLNSLWPSDTIWRHKSGSTLAQLMACCLTAPSHYLNQCWLIISRVQWHSSECNFTRDTSAISHSY